MSRRTNPQRPFELAAYLGVGLLALIAIPKILDMVNPPFNSDAAANRRANIASQSGNPAASIARQYIAAGQNPYQSVYRGEYGE